MKNKLTVKNAQGEYLQHVVFEEQQVQDGFIAMLASTHAWGKPEHQVVVTEAVYDEETGEILEEAVYETVPAEYTIEIEDVTAQLQKETRIRETAEAGAKARAACDAALDHVAGYNLKRELTSEQITTMTQTFSTIMTLLAVARRPGEARKAILLVNPDGTIVTEELKEDLLQILKDY